MRQRGFIQGPLLLYGGIAAGVLIVGMSGTIWLQTWRLDNCKTEYAEFVAKTKAAGETADKENRAREAQELKLKEKTDADHKTTVARLNRDIKRLRDDNARRSLTPQPDPGSRRPDLACFDRPDFDRALREFEAEVIGLLAEGAAAALDLDAARGWAAGLPR